MANAFLSETDKEIGTSTATVFTCGSSTESTIIGLSVANRVTSQILVDVELDASSRTSGSEDKVFLVKDAPIPVGGTLVVIGGDQKVVLEPGDAIKVTSDTASSADVVLSHLDIT
tara:strand:- start:179 stop:523 length:345 start_codon:yes stop_codon:yes gene_type:complete